MDQVKLMRNRLAQRVRECRKARGWTQEDLADRWGRSRHSVVRLEGGDGDTDLDLLVNLAEVFELTLSEFAWPVIAVEEADGEQERARERFLRELALHWQERRERYLAALSERQAVWVLEWVNTIAAYASQEQMSLVLAMLQTIATRVIPIDEAPGVLMDEASLVSARSRLRWTVQSE